MMPFIIRSESARPEVVDLFCGAGGLELGSHYAGFSTRYAFDFDADLTSSFADNFPNTPLRRLDLARTSADDIAKLIGNGRLAGIIGGPPCQGFSEIGRRQESDPRNTLLGRFMMIVAKIKPKFFLMENVPGLRHSRYSGIIDHALEQIPSTYVVLERLLLNAADYGAATDRPRIVIFGYDRSCVDAVATADLLGSRDLRTTVREAITDLPSPVATNGASLAYPDEEPVSNYAALMRRPPPGKLSNTYARKLQLQGQVTGVEATHHSTQVIDRFRKVKQGDRDPVSRYPRLHWDKPAPVLRAGTGSDKGSYQAARPIHPEEPRVITVREAARLQGFPDWFQFSPTKWHSHRMIGNSVSPIFAEAIMKVVRQRLGTE